VTSDSTSHGRHLTVTEVGGGKCIANQQCGGQFVGACYYGICYCNDRYTGDFCQNAKKLRLQAFMYSFMLGGWGADRFYLGYTGLAVLKLILGLLPLLFSCLTGTILRGKGCLHKGVHLLTGVTIVGIIVFWVYDWVTIAQNKMLDAQGNVLYDNF